MIGFAFGFLIAVLLGDLMNAIRDTNERLERERVTRQTRQWYSLTVMRCGNVETPTRKGRLVAMYT